MTTEQAIQQLERSERGQMGCKLLRDFLKSPAVNFMDNRNHAAISQLVMTFAMGTGEDAANVIDALDGVIDRNKWVNQNQ